MDFEFNFRFPPTDDQIDLSKEQIQRAGEIICDATDGQIRFENVRLTGGAVDEDRADIWYFAENFRSGVSFFLDGSSLGRLGNHINLGQGGIRADIIAHELGHHAFGLGDQYDEQRRFGGPCGIGRGFEPGAVDERNHSIMQQSGFQRCVIAGNGCFDNGGCPTGDTCAPVLMSELSVAVNHDPVRGDNMVCPTPLATTAFAITAQLNRNDPEIPFDSTDFDTAEMTSQLMRDIEILDSKGEVDNVFKGSSSHRLKAFFEHVGPQVWNIHFGIDDGDISGGIAGDLNIFGTVNATFNTDGTLTSLTPAAPMLSIMDLANGADDLDLAATLNLSETNSNSRFFFPTGALDGLPQCPADDCAARWNITTQRWESTQQTLAHDEDSDWQTLVENYPFVIQPVGLPIEDTPPICNTPINFTEEVIGSDQVMLIIDRSGSMSAPITESAEQTRLDFAKAAARAFVDLSAGRGGICL